MNITKSKNMQGGNSGITRIGKYESENDLRNEIGKVNSEGNWKIRLANHVGGMKLKQHVERVIENTFLKGTFRWILNGELEIRN